jgi:hypothetical protein
MYHALIPHCRAKGNNRGASSDVMGKQRVTFTANRYGSKVRASGGNRPSWDDLPGFVRDRIEAELGDRVIAAVSQPAGFSPGLASRLTLANGSRVFVKAASATVNEVTAFLHRQEAAIAARLPRLSAVAPLVWTREWDDWIVLAFEDIEGCQPQLPWDERELARVVDALDEMWSALTPAPFEAPPARTRLGDAWWPSLARTPERVPPWASEHIDALAALEARWPDASEGDTLLHYDLRADNLLLTDAAVVVVDWPWASIGGAWVDAVLFLGFAETQGAPPIETTLGMSALAGDIDDEAVDGLLAALAGFLLGNSLLPPPPGLPTIRAFQAQGAEGVLRALARRWPRSRALR